MRLVILCCVLLWTASGTIAQADDPPHPKRTTAKTPLTGFTDLPESVLLPVSVVKQPLCLTAGDRGPYFSLVDLQTYTPPPPKPHSAITPPVWKTYPEDLDSFRPLARSYTTETIAYMAQHEIRSGDPRSTYVALTFDCETGPSSTRQILETLRNANVRATFFVLGRYAYMWPEIIREIVQDDHELGSHSFFHPLFTDISLVTATNEITYTEAAIARATGAPVPMRYFRFPYGGRNNATRVHLATLGYQSAFWDLDPRGWEPEKAEEDVVAYVRRAAHGGGIIILHCGSWDDVHALPGITQAIREKGLEPGTLSDVLGPADRNVPGYVLPAPLSP